MVEDGTISKMVQLQIIVPKLPKPLNVVTQMDELGPRPFDTFRNDHMHGLKYFRCHGKLRDNCVLYKLISRMMFRDCSIEKNDTITNNAS